MPDPDLEIRGEGEQSPKNWPQFDLKLRGRGPNPKVPPQDPPLGDYS